jgi:hypothetical protein
MQAANKKLGGLFLATLEAVHDKREPPQYSSSADTNWFCPTPCSRHRLKVILNPAHAA